MPVRKPRSQEPKPAQVEVVETVEEVVVVDTPVATDRKVTLPNGLVVSQKYYEAHKHKLVK